MKFFVGHIENPITKEPYPVKTEIMGYKVFVDTFFQYSIYRYSNLSDSDLQKAFEEIKRVQKDNYNVFKIEGGNIIGGKISKGYFINLNSLEDIVLLASENEEGVFLSRFYDEYQIDFGEELH